MLDWFSADLDQLRRAIERGDGETIMARFQRAKHARDNLYLNGS
jgi:prephenate dehydrogenase